LQINDRSGRFFINVSTVGAEPTAGFKIVVVGRTRIDTAIKKVAVVVMDTESRLVVVEPKAGFKIVVVGPGSTQATAEVLWQQAQKWRQYKKIQ
jgi:hypothetical protein